MIHLCPILFNSLIAIKMLWEQGGKSSRVGKNDVKRESIYKNTYGLKLKKGYSGGIWGPWE